MQIESQLAKSCCLYKDVSKSWAYGI
jgi:hypothetical protein